MDSETKSVLSPQPVVIASAWKWGVPAFAVCAMAVLGVTNGNIALFQLLNTITSQAADAWWSHVTLLGDASLALLLILPLLGRYPHLVWQFVLAAIFASLWSQGGKELFSSLRPPSVLPMDSFHLIGPMLEHNSFPSGHTTTIFVLSGLVCMQPLNDRIKSFMLALAVLVGLSRIACGVHWPLDVLGGMLGGWLSAVAGVALAQRWQAGLNVWFQRMVAVLITALAFWTMFSYDNGIPGTWLFQFIISASCLIGSLKGQYRLFTLK